MKRSATERLAANSREAVCFTRGLSLPCWVYTGALGPKGYAVVKVANHRNMPAHRAAYLELIGPIPAELELDHLCRNRACWNPWHTDPVTHSVNVQRGLAAAGIRARAAQIVRCPVGHDYVGANDKRGKNGKRYCLACAVERDRRKRAARGAGIPNAAKTHCPKGHLYDAENTYVSPSGQRMCRTCRRSHLQAHRARKAKAQP